MQVICEDSSCCESGENIPVIFHPKIKRKKIYEIVFCIEKMKPIFQLLRFLCMVTYFHDNQAMFTVQQQKKLQYGMEN